MKLNLLTASAVFATMSFGAHAATIERSFDVTASDFFLSSGSSTPPPIDPVTLNFTLTWDPSVSVTSASTAGFTINAFNLPNPPYSLAYTYDSSTANLVVATFPKVDGCSVGDTAFCVVINDAAGATPFANGATQAISFTGLWDSNTVAVTASSPAVPEPSTWAMMLIGFGGVGWLAQRHRSAAAGTA
jgi:hypothetical protein